MLMRDPNLSSQDQTLQRYVKRVFELRQQSYAALDFAALQNIAIELGMTSTDLQVARTQAQAHLTRGQGYLQYRRWQDAIDELEEAAALNPLDVATVYHLARAYKGRYFTTYQVADKQTAMLLARHCLELKPDHQPALELLNELDQPKLLSRRLKLSLAGLGLGILLMGIGLTGGMIYRWLIFKPREGLAPQPVSVGPDSSAQAAPIAAANEGSLEIDPVLDAEAVDWDTFQPPTAQVNYYPDRSYLTLKGVLVNKSNQELSRLELQIEYLDEEGGRLGVETWEALSGYEALRRPHDRIPITLVQKVDPKVKQVRLTVHSLEGTPVQPGIIYEPAILKGDETLRWPDPPAEMAISLAERRAQSIEFSATGKVSHQAIWEFTNTGKVAIRQFKVRINYFDANGREIVNDDRAAERYLVLSSDPPMLPGETRLLKNILVGDRPVARYEITVIQAE